MQNPLSALRRWVLGNASAITPVDDLEERRYSYGLWDACYRGTAYQPQVDGGYRELILRDHLGVPAEIDGDKARLVAHYNPVRPIVDLHQRALPGGWGKSIKLDPDETADALLDKDADPVGRIWRAGNLDVRKADCLHWGALFGCCGLRVVASPGTVAHPVPDHPSRIADYETDARGNVVWVRLEYDQPMGRGDARRVVKVVEELDKKGFSVTHDGQEQLKGGQRINALGVCPFVLWRIGGDRFGPWGEPAHGSASEVGHRINWLLTEQGDSVYAHMWPSWFVAAGGRAPTSIDLGKFSAAYTQTDKDTPSPLIQAIVPQLDHAAATGYVRERKGELRTSYPELAYSETRELSGLSGEAYANLLKPASQRVLDTRATATDALRRALQISLSFDVVLNGLNVGSGTGSREAADRAYRDGLLELAFADMPALPRSVYEDEAAERARVAPQRERYIAIRAGDGAVSLRRRLEELGYTDEDVKAELDERAKADDSLPQSRM